MTKSMNEGMVIRRSHNKGAGGLVSTNVDSAFSLTNSVNFRDKLDFVRSKYSSVDRQRRREVSESQDVSSPM